MEIISGVGTVQEHYIKLSMGLLVNGVHGVNILASAGEPKVSERECNIKECKIVGEDLFEGNSQSLSFNTFQFSPAIVSLMQLKFSFGPTMVSVVTQITCLDWFPLLIISNDLHLIVRNILV